MASVEKRGDGFRVRWRTLAGEPRSRQCPDRATARKLRAEIDREIASGRDWSAAPDRGPGTVADLAADYLADCRRRLSPKTVRWKGCTLAGLIGFLSPGGEAPGPAALTRDNLHRWHASLLGERSRRTAAQYLSEAGSLWQWAFESDTWSSHVCPPRRLDPGPVPPPPRLPTPTLAQVDAAIEQARLVPVPTTARVMLIMRYQGIRAGQSMQLLWSDVDFEGLRMVIRPELGKSQQERRGRVIPLHPALAAEMAGWGRREGLLVGREVRQMQGRTLAMVWARAGFPDVPQPLHGIRHAVATHLRSTGTPEDIVGAILGHVQTVTGAHYVDPVAMWPMLVSAVSSIPPVGARGVSELDAHRRKSAPQ